MTCSSRLAERIGLIFAGLLLLVSARVQAQPSPLTEHLQQAGPYGSGVTTLTLVDPTRETPPNGSYEGAPDRTLVTEVWYPAADPSADGVRDAAVASGSQVFPLIVHGHGFGSSRTQVAFLAEHLATHGYVVAAMDFPLSHGEAPGGPTSIDLPGQVGDMIFVSQALLFHEFPVAGTIDASRLAFSGHSFGGLTTALAGEITGDAAYMMAPATCGLFLPGGPGSSLAIPSFTIGGNTDPVTPFDLNVEPLYEAVDDPKFLVEIDNGSHLGFVDSAPLIEQSFPGPVDNYLCTQFPEVDDPNAEACGLCTSLATEPQLSTVRQLNLTEATALAFFDSYLRDQPLSKAYLQHILEHENSELLVSYSGNAGVGQ